MAEETGTHGTAHEAKWKKRFLAALTTVPIVRRACRLARVSKTHVYRCRAEDPEFAAAWDEAEDAAVDAAEAKAWERAKTSSDSLLALILKTHRPKYRETIRQEHTGPGGGPICFAQQEIDDLPRDQLAEQLREASALLAADGSPPES